nr:MAG TPA: hypothetical protein [Caudoviricetes sp.]
MYYGFTVMSMVKPYFFTFFIDFITYYPYNTIRKIKGEYNERFRK